jgi:DNA replication and repair protein RecF
MILESLRVVNFRNYEDRLVELNCGLEIIVGPNGIGKTNILEAIHLVCEGSSFRLKKDLELVKKGCEWARVEANFDLDGRPEKRVLKLAISGERISKRMEINGVNRIASKHLLPVVVFEPDQMRMMTEGPELRRSYLDDRISFLDFEYAKNIAAYRRVILQRNRLLKQIKKGEAKKEDLFIWHVKLSELAAPIIMARRKYIDELNEKLENDYRKISKDKDKLAVEYLPSFYRDGSAKLSSDLFNKLEEGVEIDIQSGFTRHGPHRDDWMINLNNQSAATGASRGEIRTIILSLKLYEFEHLREGFGITPLVLLDDVMSELDKSRRKELLEFFKDAQVVMSGVE